MDTHSSINLSLLENRRDHACGKITARCPACAEEGHDNTGNHLCIFPRGKFACVLHQGEAGREHRKKIKALVGINIGHFTPLEAEEQIQRHKEQFSSTIISARNELAFRTGFPNLEKKFAWSPAAVSADSPQTVENYLVREDPRWFLRSLFMRDDLLWIGETFETGNEWNARQWRTCEEICLMSDPLKVGPLTTPSTWPRGCFSRSEQNVLGSPYVVLDFDEHNGKKPETAAEIEILKARSRAIINWLRREQGWKLAAVLDTGNKSLHAWFHRPPSNILDSLKPFHKVLGLDNALLDRSSQPCRLPGHLHPKSGNLSKVLWLQHPVSNPS